MIKPLTQRDNRGRQLVAVEKADGTKVTLYSHDWTDPTSWYESAVRVVAEVATDTGDHLTYNLAHEYVIDTYHGKITQEDFILSPGGHSYRVIVAVDGVVKTEIDPHSDVGDYTIDYAAGSITFTDAQTAESVITATYHYAVNSTFTVRPSSGRTLTINFVEVQFSADVQLTDSVVFQAYGFVDVFAPQLMPGVPSGTKIPLGNPLIYKGMKDFMNDAVRSYVKYPALGGNSWRGIQQDTVVFDWDYTRSTPLSSAAGMEIKIKLQHDIPFVGTYATATLYGGSDVE